MAISQSLVYGPVAEGPNQLMARYKIGFDSSHAGTGEDIDLTDEFTYVTEANFMSGCDASADAMKAIPKLIGTFDTTYYAMKTTGMKIVALRAGSSAGDAFDNSNTDDLSDMDEIILTVRGW